MLIKTWNDYVRELNLPFRSINVEELKEMTASENTTDTKDSPEDDSSELRSDRLRRDQKVELEIEQIDEQLFFDYFRERADISQQGQSSDHNRNRTIPLTLSKCQQGNLRSEEKESSEKKGTNDCKTEEVLNLAEFTPTNKMHSDISNKSDNEIYREIYLSQRAQSSGDGMDVKKEIYSSRQTIREEQKENQKDREILISEANPTDHNDTAERTENFSARTVHEETKNIKSNERTALQNGVTRKDHNSIEIKELPSETFDTPELVAKSDLIQESKGEENCMKKGITDFLKQNLDNAFRLIFPEKIFLETEKAEAKEIHSLTGVGGKKNALQKAPNENAVLQQYSDKHSKGSELEKQNAINLTGTNISENITKCCGEQIKEDFHDYILENSKCSRDKTISTLGASSANSLRECDGETVKGMTKWKSYDWTHITRHSDEKESRQQKGKSECEFEFSEREEGNESKSNTGIDSKWLIEFDPLYEQGCRLESSATKLSAADISDGTPNQTNPFRDFENEGESIAAVKDNSTDKLDFKSPKRCLNLLSNKNILPKLEKQQFEYFTLLESNQPAEYSRKTAIRVDERDMRKNLKSDNHAEDCKQQERHGKEKITDSCESQKYGNADVPNENDVDNKSTSHGDKKADDSQHTQNRNPFDIYIPPYNAKEKKFKKSLRNFLAAGESGTQKLSGLNLFGCCPDCTEVQGDKKHTRQRPFGKISSSKESHPETGFRERRSRSKSRTTTDRATRRQPSSSKEDKPPDRKAVTFREDKSVFLYDPRESIIENFFQDKTRQARYKSRTRSTSRCSSGKKQSNLKKKGGNATKKNVTFTKDKTTFFYDPKGSICENFYEARTSGEEAKNGTSDLQTTDVEDKEAMKNESGYVNLAFENCPSFDHVLGVEGATSASSFGVNFGEDEKLLSPDCDRIVASKLCNNAIPLSLTGMGKHAECNMKRWIRNNLLAHKRLSFRKMKTAMKKK